MPNKNEEIPDDINLYSSMLSLWQNRDKHQIFVVALFMDGVHEGLPALRDHCQTHNKCLLVDVHECKEGCSQPPDIRTVAHRNLKEIDKSVIIPEYREKVIVLEDYMYKSLVKMAKMGLASLKHENVPIVWNEERKRLESAYGDKYYTKIDL